MTIAIEWESRAVKYAETMIGLRNHLIFLAVLTGLVPDNAMACSCIVLDICKRVKQTRTIFLGEVIDGDQEPGQEAWKGTAEFARLRVIESCKKYCKLTQLLNTWDRICVG